MWCRLRLKPPLISTFRRYLYQYKPRDKTVPESISTESLASKDILLFRYENPRAILIRNAAATAIWLMCSYSAHTAWKLKDAFVDYREDFSKSDKSWVLRNVEGASRGVSIAFFLCGAVLCMYWVVRNMYTVRRLVLRKGGRHVTLVTYGITGVNSRQTTVPLSHCSGKSRRLDEKERFFINVKDHPKSFEVNLKEGIMGNRALFDRTVGISRRI